MNIDLIQEVPQLEQGTPPFLCRYRKVNKSTLDALKQGKLFFSTPKYFNDPFDSVAYLDEDKLIRSVTAQIENGIRTGYVPKSSIVKLPDDVAKNILKGFNNIEYRQAFFCRIRKEASKLRSCVRNNTRVICFSEACLSTLMWTHYADEHKGFELVYDYEMLKKAASYNNDNKIIKDKTILGKVEYYSCIPDRGQLFFDVLPDQMNPFHRSRMTQSFYQQLLFVKLKEWAYEKEWRLCVAGEDILIKNQASYLQIDPVAIFLGVRMNPEDKKHICEIAKERNIVVFDVFADDTTHHYTLNIKETNPNSWR